ncbi:hypothetical protein HDU98_012116 [Podochytrium sp. JEL0797]|nr:hypothetical protein HDU98_012116 [Podochytrium sp. JEL0797]
MVCQRSQLIIDPLKNTLQFPATKKVYVLGMCGLKEELENEGIRHRSDSDNLQTMSEISSIKHDPEVGAVLFVVMAPLGPTRKPTVIGKPESTMMDVIVDKFHLNRERTCLVGDRLDTDILFGKHGGLKTLLVLTGVTPKEGLEKQAIRADYVIDSLGYLF